MAWIQSGDARDGDEPRGSLRGSLPTRNGRSTRHPDAARTGGIVAPPGLTMVPDDANRDQRMVVYGRVLTNRRGARRPATPPQKTPSISRSVAGPAPGPRGRIRGRALPRAR